MKPEHDFQTLHHLDFQGYPYILWLQPLVFGQSFTTTPLFPLHQHPPGRVSMPHPNVATCPTPNRFYPVMQLKWHSDTGFSSQAASLNLLTKLVKIKTIDVNLLLEPTSNISSQVDKNIYMIVDWFKTKRERLRPTRLAIVMRSLHFRPCWDPSPHQGAGFVLAHLEARFWPSLRLQIDSLSKKKESCKEEAMIYATNLELQKSFINDA